MSFKRELDFKIGNGLFRRLWVTSPSSTNSADGLGPLFNARPCQRCHPNDGRGHPPTSADDSAGYMFLPLSIPPQSESGLSFPARVWRSERDWNVYEW